LPKNPVGQDPPTLSGVLNLAIDGQAETAIRGSHMQIQSSRNLTFSLVSTLLNLIILSNAAQAGDVDAADIRGSTTVKPVSVLQNRFFLKTLRPEIGVIAGTMLNEAYTKTTTNGVRMSLFFNEWVGVETQTIRTAVKDTADRKALNLLKYRSLDAKADGTDEIVSPDPEVNPIHAIQDANIIAAPFYGKINLFDQMIVYADVYVTAGTSRVETDQGELTAGSIGVGQRFYFGKSFSLRFDFRDRIFTELRAGSKTTKNAYSVDMGLSYFFL